MIHTRREARERALGLVYEAEQRGLPVGAVIAGLPAAPDGYATRLAEGTEAHRAEIDALLSAHSERWAVERMPVVDRSLLRVAIFELGWVPEVPTGVVVSEAVELAKQYSTKDSGRFVHGMLSSIADALRGPVEPAAAGS